MVPPPMGEQPARGDMLLPDGGRIFEPPRSLLAQLVALKGFGLIMGRLRHRHS